MKTLKLDTGVIVTFDKFDNMISVTSPYYKSKKVRNTFKKLKTKIGLL